MTPTAVLNEIFASYQGEGAYPGAPQVFVRFQGCSQRCRWCDSLATLTTQRTHFRIEKHGHSAEFEDRPNPVTISQLNLWLTQFPERFLSITGGEPLEQVDFLTEWLPTIPKGYTKLLETAGIHPQALAKILNDIDIISMDWKLPSSTGDRDYGQQHRDFLKISQAKKVYIKCVVTENTDPQEIESMLSFIKAINPSIPLYLQPVTPTATFSAAPQRDTLMRHMGLAQSALSHVYLVPQIHKSLGLL